MQHDDFVGQVQQAARLPSRGDAERAIRTTLETLGERIPDGLAHNPAAQLPHEVGEHLRRMVSDGDGVGERFDLSEFVSRVAERSGADEPKATHLARAVLEVVDTATLGDIMGRVEASQRTFVASQRPEARAKCRRDRNNPRQGSSVVRNGVSLTGLTRFPRVAMTAYARPDKIRARFCH